MTGSDQSLLAAEQVMGLFIVNSGRSGFSDTVSASLIAGTFVAIVIVVIGIAILGIWFAYLRRLDGDRIYAEPSPTLENNP
jgi:hypothetical protein